MSTPTFADTNVQERTNEVTKKGDPLTLLGPRLTPGEKAPDFALLRTDGSVAGLEEYRGRTVILSTVPSLDTPVCDRQARRFNEEAARLPETAMLIVSMDLPYAQKRWCGQADAEAIEALSDHRKARFGLEYGVLIKENRLLARAVFVIDPSGTLRHVQVVPDLVEEPDYDDALRAARACAS